MYFLFIYVLNEPEAEGGKGRAANGRRDEFEYESIEVLSSTSSTTNHMLRRSVAGTFSDRLVYVVRPMSCTYCVDGDSTQNRR